MAKRVTPEQKKILLEYVTYEDGNAQGRWTCKLCNHPSSGRPNRIVAHLLRIEVKGIKVCPGMEDTQEREKLARRLGRDTQPKQIFIPMDDTFSIDSLLKDDNDKDEETSAMGSEMGNTMPEGQSCQRDPTQTFFTQGCMNVYMDDPVYTPSQVVFDHMNYQDMHPSHGATVDPSRAVNSMDTEGQQQQQPGEEYDSLNHLGDIENTSSRAVSSDVCLNQEHFPNVQDLGIAGCKGGVDNPSQVVFDHMNYQDMHPSHGATVDPSRAVNSMDIEGQQQQQPGEEYDSVNNLGDIENTASRAVSSDVCINQEHFPNVQDLGIAGCKGGGVSSDVRIRMQNTFGQDKGNKRRKCASGNGTSGSDPTEAETPQVGVSNSCSALSEFLPQAVECTLPSSDQQRAHVPNTDNDGVEETNAVESEMTNAVRQAQSSQHDSIRVSSQQGGRDMGMDDLTSTPRPSKVSFGGKGHRTVAMAVRSAVRIQKAFFEYRRVKEEIRRKTEEGVQVLGEKRKSEMKRWLAYGATFESDVDDLGVNFEKVNSPEEIQLLLEAKSPEEIESWLKRIEELKKVADILIKTGKDLLNPIVPKDLFSWNPNSLSCRSQLQNQMNPGWFPQQA